MLKNIKHKKLFLALSILFYIVIGGCTFPVYIFTPDYIHLNSAFRTVLACWVFMYMGIEEAYIFKDANIFKIIAINIVLLLFSLIFRYILEFGEVSNSYNFTALNISVHFATAIIISTASYLHFMNKNSI